MSFFWRLARSRISYRLHKDSADTLVVAWYHPAERLAEVWLNDRWWRLTYPEDYGKFMALGDLKKLMEELG